MKGRLLLCTVVALLETAIFRLVCFFFAITCLISIKATDHSRNEGVEQDTLKVIHLVKLKVRRIIISSFRRRERYQRTREIDNNLKIRLTINTRLANIIPKRI